jgi:hypothetical protein
MESGVYEFAHCALRSRVHRVADRAPWVRSVAALLWPAASRADRVELAQDGIRARSLAGFTRIGWDEVALLRRHRTRTGRVTLVIEGAARSIEISEAIPDFTALARAVHERSGVGEVVALPDRAAA